MFFERVSKPEPTVCSSMIQILANGIREVGEVIHQYAGGQRLVFYVVWMCSV